MSTMFVAVQCSGSSSKLKILTGLSFKLRRKTSSKQTVLYDINKARKHVLCRLITSAGVQDSRMLCGSPASAGRLAAACHEPVVPARVEG